MKWLSLIRGAFLIAVVLLFSVASVALYSSGAPPGRTGAPGDYGTCASAGCHNSHPPNSGTGFLAIEGPSEYTPGETIDFLIRVTDPAASLFGFEISAQTPDSMFAGIWDGSKAGVQFAGGSTDYVTHNPAQFAVGGFSWSLTWTAPQIDVGSITLYAAGNAANNNGSTSGDMIYTSTRVLSSPSTTLAEREVTPSDFNLVSVYPNPFVDHARVSYSLDRATSVSLDLFDALGRQISSHALGTQTAGKHETEISGDGLPSGLLFYRLRTETSSRMGTVIQSR